METDFDVCLLWCLGRYQEEVRSHFFPIKFYFENETEEIKEDPSLLVSLLR